MRALRRWWWIPVAALLAIALKALLLTPWVAGKAEDAAIAALDADGLSAADFVEVDGVSGLGGDGLNVVVEGPAGDQVAAVAALEARDEINNVIYRPIGDGAASPAEDEEAPAEEPEDPAPAAPALEPMAVTVAAADGAIVLTGSVSAERDRTALVNAAVTEYGATNVTDQLTIDDGLTAEGGELVLTGEAASGIERDEWLAKGTAVADVGALNLVDRLTVRAVEDQLNDLFALEPIEFDVARATIRSESEATLDRAATVLNENTDAGRLRVVGHTDGDGAATANQQLSDARATAVVDYLVTTGDVSAERLEAEGRGENELLVDPEVSSEDKQRNRRIEWELIS